MADGDTNEATGSEMSLRKGDKNMAPQVTVTLPDRVYNQLLACAKAQRRTLKQVAEEMLCAAVESSEALSPPLEAELHALCEKSDEELRAIAESRWPRDRERKWQRLVAKRDKGKLTEAEQKQLQDLLTDMDHFMVIQSEAWALLKQRGHRIPTLDEMEQCARAKGWLK